MNREIRETWLERGAKTLGERLREKVELIIEEHRPEPLGPEVKGQVEEILLQARTRS